MLNFRGEGLSVMEMSHRSKTFEAILNEAAASVKKVVGFSDNYSVLFLQGGATGQFAAVPVIRTAMTVLSYPVGMSARPRLAA